MPPAAHLHLQLPDAVLQVVNHPSPFLLLLLKVVDWVPGDPEIVLQHFNETFVNVNNPVKFLN